MGITKRIRDIWMAGVNDKLDSMESPESLIKQYLRDLEEDLAKAEDAARSHLTIEKRQELFVSETEAFITKRERQAKLAIETGQDHIAKHALKDKLDYKPRLAVYREQLEIIQAHTVQLFEQLKELKTKYAELQQKKIVLMSRANATASIEHVNRTLSTSTPPAPCAVSPAWKTASPSKKHPRKPPIACAPSRRRPRRLRMLSSPSTSKLNSPS